MYEMTRSLKLFLCAHHMSWLFACLAKAYELLGMIPDISFWFAVRLRRHHPEKQPQFAAIRNLKDKHQGKRCFIVCTGPSLTLEDIEKLHQNSEICFTVNSALKLYEKTDWRADYYLCQDLNILKPEKGELLDIYQKYVNHTFFVPDYFYHPGKHGYDIDPPAFSIPDEAVWTPFIPLSYYNSIPHFRWRFRDCYEYVTLTPNVSTTALQIAIYLGFSEIYILGADCGFADSQRHMSDVEYKDHAQKSAADVWQPKWWKRGDLWDCNFAYYEALKHHADSRGQKIYNATRGGRLEVFERVDLNEVLRKPKK